jgi:hypothetical protein
VSLGTQPDYGWSGKGVRLDDVRAGTPAAQAGLQPAEAIGIRYLRDGSEHRTTARVNAR